MVTRVGATKSLLHTGKVLSALAIPLEAVAQAIRYIFVVDLFVSHIIAGFSLYIIWLELRLRKLEGIE